MSEDNECSVVECHAPITVRCGTWGFCTLHAIGMAKVDLNEDGWGHGLWGTARADDPEVIRLIRMANGQIPADGVVNEDRIYP